MVAACYDGTYSAQCPLPPSGVDIKTIAIVFGICALVLGTIIVVCVWIKYIRNHETYESKAPNGGAGVGADVTASRAESIEDRKRLIGQQPFIDALSVRAAARRGGRFGG